MPSLTTPLDDQLTVAQDLRLDNNSMQELLPGDLGPHASALRSLDLGGSRFGTVSSSGNHPNVQQGVAACSRPV
jgi:hypothetical protein